MATWMFGLSLAAVNRGNIALLRIRRSPSAQRYQSIVYARRCFYVRTFSFPVALKLKQPDRKRYGGFRNAVVAKQQKFNHANLFVNRCPIRSALIRITELISVDKSLVVWRKQWFNWKETTGSRPRSGKMGRDGWVRLFKVLMKFERL